MNFRNIVKTATLSFLVVSGSAIADNDPKTTKLIEEAASVEVIQQVRWKVDKRNVESKFIGRYLPLKDYERDSKQQKSSQGGLFGVVKSVGSALDEQEVFFYTFGVKRAGLMNIDMVFASKDDLGAFYDGHTTLITNKDGSQTIVSDKTVEEVAVEVAEGLPVDETMYDWKKRTDSIATVRISPNGSIQSPFWMQVIREQGKNVISFNFENRGCVSKFGQPHVSSFSMNVGGRDIEFKGYCSTKEIHPSAAAYTPVNTSDYEYLYNKFITDASVSLSTEDNTYTFSAKGFNDVVSSLR